MDKLEKILRERKANLDTGKVEERKTKHKSVIQDLYGQVREWLEDKERAELVSFTEESVFMNELKELNMLFPGKKIAISPDTVTYEMDLTTYLVSVNDYSNRSEDRVILKWTQGEWTYYHTDYHNYEIEAKDEEKPLTKEAFMNILVEHI